MCENGEWKMMTVDESKPRGRAPPFCQRLLKLAPFHIVIQLLVLVNAIVAASMHFDHRTPSSTRNDPYTWYYYTEVSNLPSTTTTTNSNIVRVIAPTISNAP